MRTCLGTRVVEFENTTAALLVEHSQDLLDIKLSTATGDCYGCSIAISAVSCLSSNEKLLDLGRLLLDEKKQNDEQDELTTRFQYDNDRNIVLWVHENLPNGMKRKLMNQKLEFIGSGLQYAVAAGKALNQALQEIQQLTAAKDDWKKTANYLDKLHQTQTNTLVANFTKLRNKLVEKHQEQLETMKKAHQTALKTAAGKKQKRIEDEPPQALELFANDQMMALAQGRKLDAARSNKRAVLDEPVDMVQIRQEGLEYQRRKPKKRKESASEKPHAKKSCTATTTEKQTGKPKKHSYGENLALPQSMPDDDASTTSESSWKLK